MDYQNGEILLQKNSKEQCKKDSSKTVSLRDIPLEVRRKDAKKPLFLFRYE